LKPSIVTMQEANGGREIDPRGVLPDVELVPCNAQSSDKARPSLIVSEFSSQPAILACEEIDQGAQDEMLRPGSGISELLVLPRLFSETESRRGEPCHMLIMVE
jgi:hypothetical protein